MVEYSADWHHIVINGRKWRATDPSIPDALRTELVAELMASRRAVAAASTPSQERTARDRVSDAKVALGERGAPWWEPLTGAQLDHRIDASILVLLHHRRPDSSICPSDAAKCSAGVRSWRDIMDDVRRRAGALADHDVVQISQSGQAVPATATWSGPIRIRRGVEFPAI